MFLVFFFGNKIKEENERHVWVCVKRRTGEESTTNVAINRKQYLPAIRTHTHTQQRQEQVKCSIARDDDDNVKKGDSLFSFQDYETKTR